MDTKKKGRRSRKNQAIPAFVAQIEPITHLLDEGWSMSAIYADFRLRLDVSYSQFTRYVEQYIRPKTTAIPPELLPQIAAALAAGNSMKAVHAHFVGKTLSYMQFTRYVHRFVGRKEKLHATNAPAPSVPVRKKAVVRMEPQTASNTAPHSERRAGPIVTQARETKRFIFDPTAAHRRKDELF